MRNPNSVEAMQAELVPRDPGLDFHMLDDDQRRKFTQSQKFSLAVKKWDRAKALGKASSVESLLDDLHDLEVEDGETWEKIWDMVVSKK